MGEIRHLVAVHFEVDGDGRTAQTRMGRRGCVRVGKAPNPRNRARKFDDAAVINLVEHAKILNSGPAVLPAEPYIGTGWARRESSVLPAMQRLKHRYVRQHILRATWHRLRPRGGFSADAQI